MTGHLLAVRRRVHYREKAPPVKEAGVAKTKGEVENDGREAL
jgi:hypothetical protein